MTTQAQRRWLRQAVDMAPIGIVPTGRLGGMRHFSVVRLLNRMVEAGLLAQADPKSPYTITDAGCEALKPKRRGRRSKW